MQSALRRKKTRGFTIVEIAMAAGVMALAITSALIAMGRAFAPLDSARCISYASQIMQSEMEKMRLTTWGNGTLAGSDPGGVGITAYPTSTTNVPLDTTFINAGDLGSRMTMTRTTRDVYTGVSGMIQITLTITWTTYDRRTMSRSYTTYYAKNGLYDYFSS